ncbi:MAG TPA: hypothetical protein PL157_23550, partial [Acidobacteriota bacterium]|nr:hypothetical protein [Acidobacteriota bacterium]
MRGVRGICFLIERNVSVRLEIAWVPGTWCLELNIFEERSTKNKARKTRNQAQSLQPDFFSPISSARLKKAQRLAIFSWLHRMWAVFFILNHHHLLNFADLSSRKMLAQTKCDSVRREIGGILSTQQN